MSRDDLTEHVRRFHDCETQLSRDAHNRLHHFTRANHAHRSAPISAPDHADWRKQ